MSEYFYKTALLYFLGWNERFKQILKKWRALPSEEKAPYLQRARDNRANFRNRKQVSLLFYTYNY